MYTGNGTYSYSCMCRPSFTGENCTQQLPSESMMGGNDCSLISEHDVLKHCASRPMQALDIEI